MEHPSSCLALDSFPTRRSSDLWSEGLHQAVEAKEGVRVKGETQTLATITIQNYFRMYEKLSGDRKSTRLNSSHLGISYAVFCLKKKNLRPAETGRNAPRSGTVY